MRILLLTQWFPPEPRPIFAEMAEELSNLGHEVTVVTGFPNWPKGEIYAGYKMRFAQWERASNYRVLRLPLYPDHSHSKVKRALNLTTLGWSFLLQALWRLPRQDAIHVVQLPTLALAAGLVGRIWRAPITIEIQDIWPETLAATGMMNNARVLSAVDGLCLRMYKRAAAIRVISPGFKSNLVDKGVPPEKITVIGNWVDPAAYRLPAPDAELSKVIGATGHFNVLYAGNMGLAQALESVLEAAEILREIPDIQILFAGEGVDSARLQEIARAKSLLNVRFIGSFSSTEMVRIYALADATLVHLSDDPLFRITIPHKILSYLAVGKPIVAAVTGDALEVIVEAGAGVGCTPGDPASIANAIRKLYDMSADERAQIGRNGKDAAEMIHSRARLVPVLERLIVGAVY